MSPIQPAGFLAFPHSSPGPAVLVLHAWWGLNDSVKSFCRRLADAGFVAFAPDLYHEQVANTIAGAEALSQALDADQAREDIAESVLFLNEYTGLEDSGLAVIGFSLGAFFALELSVTYPEQVHSVVVFYGTRPGDYYDAQAAYLGHFAEADPFEPLSAVEALEQDLRQVGCPVDFHVYPGTGHWFAEPDRVDAFDPAAASLAWARTLAFLTPAATM
jgi:carboxymethylenebutenolidase